MLNQSLRSLPVGILLAAGALFTIPASAAEEDSEEGLLGGLLPDSLGFTMGGWLQGGYTSKSTGMFNNLNTGIHANQAWIWAERVADGTDGLDWGFRADFMYGIDGTDTQAFGNNVGNWDFINGWDRGDYSFALPQLYGEIAFGDFSLKAGHFYTLLGYEVVPAPDNFFYSHSLTSFNSEPFTHTGAIASYAATDRVTLYGGWTLGWDTGFDQFNSGSNFLGGVSVSLCEAATLTYMTTIGKMGVRGDGYSHSIVLDVDVMEGLNYVLQSDFVSLDVFGGNNEEIGINQYLIYELHEKVSVGARVEWWKSNAGFNHGGQSIPPAGSHSYYEVTVGVNIKPIENVVIRPEFRYDWMPDSLGGAYEQGIFAVDAIVTF